MIRLLRLFLIAFFFLPGKYNDVTAASYQADHTAGYYSFRVVYKVADQVAQSGRQARKIPFVDFADTIGTRKTGKTFFTDISETEEKELSDLEPDDDDSRHLLHKAWPPAGFLPAYSHACLLNGKLTVTALLAHYPSASRNFSRKPYLLFQVFLI